MLTRVAVRNFKCLRDVQVDLAPLTVLIGRNDTGKSSFLQAIDTLGSLLASTTGEGSTLFDALATRGASDVSWHVTTAAGGRHGLAAASHYELDVSRTRGVWLTTKETALVSGRAQLKVRHEADNRYADVIDLRGSTPKATVSGPCGALPMFPAVGPQGAEQLVRLRAALSDVGQVRLLPSALAATTPLGRETVPTMAEDGTGLATALDYLLGEQRDAFDRIERELCEMVPTVAGILLRQTRTPRDNEPAKRLAFRLRAGGEVPADAMSDGVLLILGFLVLVHLPSTPSVILIEEPENGLHPRQLERVAKVLRRLADEERAETRVQVIATTHSPYLLDFVPPESVRVFGRDQDGASIVRPLNEIAEVERWRSEGLSLGEMWFNVGEEALLGHAPSAAE